MTGLLYPYLTINGLLVWQLYLNSLQWNEYNWNATSIVIDGKIMKPNCAWYFTRVSFATIPRTNYEERANDERTWRQTWVPRESKFAVCLKHHLSVLIFAQNISFMVVHSDVKVGEKKKYHYKSVIQLVLQQFRLIRDHLNWKFFTSIIVFDI